MSRCCAVSLLFAACLAPFASAQDVTYNRDVAPIIQAKCQMCHRDGDIAPFSLNNYNDAATWAADIKRVIDNGTMPPWKPVPGYGSFKRSYALTSDEKLTLLQWINAGAPEGDAASVPNVSTEPAEAVSEWQLGAPDLVLQMSQPFNVPKGKDLYRCFVLPTGLDAQQFVSAVQVVPGNRKLVHHVLLFMDTSGISTKLDGQDGSPGYTCFGGPQTTLGINTMLGGWVPGSRIQPLPDSIGIQLPAKANVVMQVHYNTLGKTVGPDQTKIGLYYSKTAVDKRLMFIPIADLKLKIPVNEEHYTDHASMLVPPGLDAKAILIAPHMHLLGSRIEVQLLQSGKEPQSLILINKWDFNWQGFYEFENAISIPALSTIKVTCSYNNTDSNVNNPNKPLVPVQWGENTTDEMCLAYMGVTFNNESLLAPFLQNVKPKR